MDEDDESATREVTLTFPRDEYYCLVLAATEMKVSVGQLLVDRLAKRAEPSKREIAALTILRQKALEQALTLAKPGDTPNTVEWNAVRLLEAMLGTG